MSALAKVIDLQAYRERPEGAQDDAINAIWDHLVTLAEASWSWRDADSVTALEQCVATLKKTVAEEWGASETAAVRESVRMAIS